MLFERSPFSLINVSRLAKPVVNSWNFTIKILALINSIKTALECNFKFIHLTFYDDAFFRSVFAGSYLKCVQNLMDVKAYFD